jgi:parallel beta-helix repeat protein
MLLLALAVVAASLSSPAPADAIGPGSQLIGCDQADTRVKLTANANLDPSCTWTRGVEITASDVELDCQGAHVYGPDRQRGIEIHAPTDVALANIVVRNCVVEGFLNNYHVEREGFRDLAAGVEYDHAFSNILIEDSTSLHSRGVGIFVNGYVTGVTLRNLHVEGAGSTGIYLEAGSKDNVVEGCQIVNNGYRENGPSGQIFTIGVFDFWFWGIGREGLAIDGSRDNHVVGNTFSGNSAGGIFLYKNCGEYVTSRPERWFQRRYGADGNLIEHNTFVGEDNGVWIASRMSENTFPMQCSDPQYQPGFSLDYAADDVVRDNVFQDVTFGVRIEDDGAVVADNQFTSTDPVDEAIVVGTQNRTQALGQPVDGTTITGNRATIAGNTHPYRWIWGHANTTFTDNQSFGRVVGLCEGEQPPKGPFVFVIEVVAYDPANPPSTDPREFPPPNALPPCSATCTTGGEVLRPSLIVQHVDTPAGDDALSFTGRILVPYPLTPALDPIAAGVGVVVADSSGTRALDVTVPGGAFDPSTGVGWKASRNGTRWKWTDRSATPPGGITAVSIRDLSRSQPGLLQLRVTGKRGSYPVDAANLPLTGMVSVDPPTAETGQCGRVSFPAPAGCTPDGHTVKCR